MVMYQQKWRGDFTYVSTWRVGQEDFLGAQKPLVKWYSAQAWQYAICIPT